MPFYKEEAIRDPKDLEELRNRFKALIGSLDRIQCDPVSGEICYSVESNGDSFPLDEELKTQMQQACDRVLELLQQT